MPHLEIEYPAIRRKKRIRKIEDETEFPLLNKTAWALSALWFALFIASTALSTAN